jgi:hypothetical protein
VKTILCFAAVLLALPAGANTVSLCATPPGAISCTGTLDTPEDVFLDTFTLTASASITVQTLGFGGGTDLAGETILPGGFDSLVALFSGTANAATILMDAGNPVVSADTLSLFSAGCPPAGTISVGSAPGNCGDSRFTATLGTGTYTLLLSDANFVPLAVNPGIPGAFDLTDTSSNNYGSSTGNGAYTDFTAGVFQTCATFVDGNIDSGSFADISGFPTTAVPEPNGLGVLGFLLTGLYGIRRIK